MLDVNPVTRLSAREALDSPWLTESRPAACRPNQISLPPKSAGGQSLVVKRKRADVAERKANGWLGHGLTPDSEELEIDES